MIWYNRQGPTYLQTIDEQKKVIVISASRLGQTDERAVSYRVAIPHKK